MAKKVYLVDTENVGSAWVKLLADLQKVDEIFLFYTEHSPAVSYEDVIQLFEYGDRLNFVKCYMGRNGLDFQLVTYLGYMLRSASKTEFLIVTNDFGFDSAVKFWCDRGRLVSRLTTEKIHAIVAEKNNSRRSGKSFSPVNGNEKAMNLQADGELSVPSEEEDREAAESAAAPADMPGGTERAGQAPASETAAAPERRESSGRRGSFSERRESSGRQGSVKMLGSVGRKEFAVKTEFAEKRESAGEAESAGRRESAERPESDGKRESAGEAESAGRRESSGRTRSSGRSESAGRRESSGRTVSSRRAEASEKAAPVKTEKAGKQETAAKADESGMQESAATAEKAGMQVPAEEAEKAGKRETAAKTEEAGKPEIAATAEVPEETDRSAFALWTEHGELPDAVSESDAESGIPVNGDPGLSPAGIVSEDVSASASAGSGASLKEGSPEAADPTQQVGKELPDGTSGRRQTGRAGRKKTQNPASDPAHTAASGRSETKRRTRTAVKAGNAGAEEPKERSTAPAESAKDLLKEVLSSVVEAQEIDWAFDMLRKYDIGKDGLNVIYCEIIKHFAQEKGLNVYRRLKPVIGKFYGMAG